MPGDGALLGGGAGYVDQAPSGVWASIVDAHDHLASPDLRSGNVEAFQRLWNRNNPEDRISVAGIYGVLAGNVAERTRERGDDLITRAHVLGQDWQALHLRLPSQAPRVLDASAFDGPATNGPPTGHKHPHRQVTGPVESGRPRRGSSVTENSPDVPYDGSMSNRCRAVGGGSTSTRGPYPRILDTGCDYAAVGSVAARRAS